jgi:hypothetical protein
MLLLNPYVFPLLQEFQHGVNAFAQPLCLSFANSSMNSLFLLNPNVFRLLREFQHGLNAYSQPLCLSFAAGIPA